MHCYDSHGMKQPTYGVVLDVLTATTKACRLT